MASREPQSFAPNWEHRLLIVTIIGHSSGNVISFPNKTVTVGGEQFDFRPFHLVRVL